MSDPQDIPDKQWKIYWEREYSTAIAPEPLKLDFGPHRPMMTNMTLPEQRDLAASGYMGHVRVGRSRLSGAVFEGGCSGDREHHPLCGCHAV